MPEDDDLNYPLLALDLLERHGAGITTEDVATRGWTSCPPAASSPPSGSRTATCSTATSPR